MAVMFWAIRTSIAVNTSSNSHLLRELRAAGSPQGSKLCAVNFAQGSPMPRARPTRIPCDCLDCRTLGPAVQQQPSIPGERQTCPQSHLNLLHMPCM